MLAPRNSFKENHLPMGLIVSAGNSLLLLSVNWDTRGLCDLGTWPITYDLCDLG